MNVVPLKVTEKFYRSIVKPAKICESACLTLNKKE